MEIFSKITTLCVDCKCILGAPTDPTKAVVSHLMRELHLSAAYVEERQGRGIAANGDSVSKLTQAASSGCI